MCNNSCGNNWCWIIILLLLFCNGGCGNNGCGCNGGSTYGGGCGCDRDCGCGC